MQAKENEYQNHEPEIKKKKNNDNVIKIKI